MTASLPTDHQGNDPGTEPDDVPTATLDDDAAPGTGTEPDSGGPAAAAEPDVDGVPDRGPDAAARTLLDGPAAENPEMRRGTEDLQASQDSIARARDFADEVARRTEPAEPPARPGDET